MLARPEHEVAYQDLVRLLGKHADKVSSSELLAIAANMIGKMIAMQDQRTMTPKSALELVRKNMELGNEQMLEELGKSVGIAL